MKSMYTFITGHFTTFGDLMPWHYALEDF